MPRTFPERQLDENLLESKEHIDFCITVWAGGGRILSEPAAVVTYLLPCGDRPLNKEDWAYFAWRRSTGMLEWRISEGIAKPIKPSE
jgi:hypothetical protein